MKVNHCCLVIVFNPHFHTTQIKKGSQARVIRVWLIQDAVIAGGICILVSVKCI